MIAVLDLAADGADLRRVGGKALNLGVLIRAGFPVPPGYVVTTDAYRCVAPDRLGAVLDALDAVPADRTEEIERLAGRARDLLVQAPMPDDLRHQIVAAYAGLGPEVPVAVRSSATAEDLAEASFAGQQDSFLNVVSGDAVLRAVRDCWASLWTARAVTYRKSAGVDHAGLALAVVVQRMIPAMVAGVMFTANPVTGTRTQTVIDASPGLGEAVVAGAVNPDHFVLDSATGVVVSQRLGDKRVRVRALAGGGTERVETAAAGSEPCLDADRLHALAALGSGVQRLFGAPQDLEWALDDTGAIWLTQTRPITTLYPLAERPDQPGPRVFMCLSLAQGLTRPITPMGCAAFDLIAGAVAGLAGVPRDDPSAPPSALVIAGQRPFVDLTAVFRHPFGRRLALAAARVMESRAATVLAALAEDPRFGVDAGSRAAFVWGFARVMVKTQVPARVVLAWAHPPAAYALIERHRQRLQRRAQVPADASPEDRLDLVVRELGGQAILTMPRTAAYAAAGFVALAVARRLLRGTATGQELQTVLRGLPHNVTTEMDLDLWRLAEQLRADPGGEHRLLAPFLERYGHRAVAEIDLGMPRWADDPAHLVGALRNYLELTDPELAPTAQFAAGERTAEAMVAELVARARRRGRLRARLVGLGLRRARQLAGLRESPKFLLVYQFGLLRAQLQEVGRALVARGSLAGPDDIFFLDVAEARRGLAGEPLAETVTRRRAAYAAELRRRHIPRILLSDGTEPEALLVPADAGEGTLFGAPASAGVVTAPARVILDPVGARLAPGEILVAPSTDPGWTPLFLTAGGLVMEMGGANSHGAVVAREYGIPAVVGVADATLRIVSGQLITVDGAVGSVRPA